MSPIPWLQWLKRLAPLTVLLTACPLEPGEFGEDVSNNTEFRDHVVALVRGIANDTPDLTCNLPQAPLLDPERAVVSLYHEGAIVGQGTADHERLCIALTQATRRAIDAAGLPRSGLDQTRFTVEFPNHDYALVEHEGQGHELVDGIVPTRVLDKPLVRRRIDEGAGYLRRAIDPSWGGVHKYYYAETDSYEDRLHTIYTASTIYTLLTLYTHDHDDSLRVPIERAAEFLLSMQRLTPDLAPESAHGAFYYSLDLAHQVPETRFVVGTAAKSIFTLIQLHHFDPDPRYLEAATLAGDWLLTMQYPSGYVVSERFIDSEGNWRSNSQLSLLYTGQVLSAWSRLYEATAEQRYLDAASSTATWLLALVEARGCYLGDDYRLPNPISSSWVILALFDYARASGDAPARDVAYECADQLLARQIIDPDDVINHGRWPDSLSSSGSGWLAEVLSELYLACPDSDPKGCERYRDGVVLLLRLTSQSSYSPEASFPTKDPAAALGGIFWTARDRYVRTDSVCHAMNAYVRMIDDLPEAALVELPEPPLAERLGFPSP